MRPLSLAIWVALVASCTETVELAAGAPDARPRDALPPDAEAPDSGAPDLGFADSGGEDAEVEDSGPPDAGPACVCRYVSCRTDPDCEGVIGAGSTCIRATCSGAAGPCATDVECGAGWSCTIDETALDPCR